MTSVEEPARPNGRIRDAVRTQAEILDVATQEFARAGFAGARVDEIAARTRTTKRMIYYYFGGKEQLFTAVLERAYAVIREAEQGLDVEHLDPVAAIRRLAEVTFDHHEQHPDFIRLVSIENIHEAVHIAASEKLGKISSLGARRDPPDPGTGAEVGAVHGRRGRRRPARDDQRVLLLPGRQPAHLRRPVRPRPDRSRPARALPRDARRHGDRLPDGGARDGLRADGQRLNRKVLPWILPYDLLTRGKRRRNIPPTATNYPVG